MKIVNIVRNLNDLMNLNGLRNKNNKYKIITAEYSVSNVHNIYVVFTDKTYRDTFIKITDSKPKEYFDEVSIKKVIEMLQDLGFDVIYQIDDAENIIDDLCKIVDCMEEKDIKEYLDSLKKVISRIENLK